MTYDNGVTEPDPQPVNYRFEQGAYNVHYLHAPHDLLTRAFGNDGDNPRDTYKSMAQWIIDTPCGEVEVYDYKVGTCYEADGLERHEITEWHVQGHVGAIKTMLNMVNEAGGKQRS
jgi:hypothetical protein